MEHKNSTFSLCIDTGNSSTKIAIFNGDTLVENKTFKIFSERELSEVCFRYSISSAIYSTVAERNESIIDLLKNKVCNFIEFDGSIAVPIVNEYKTPETLGKDRLAAVVGANFMKPDADILVIDAGSAITYDFINKNKSYKGGNISPGIDLRFKALHEYTSKLPFVGIDGENLFLGVDTVTAIRSGVLQGIVFEMDGYIDHLRTEYHQLSTFLTGGNTFYFANKLKNAIFANTNLVLIGLNRILQYNV